MTCGWHRTCPPVAAVVPLASAACCACAALASTKTIAASRSTAMATVWPQHRDCRTSPERGRTDVSLMPRKLPFTRFTVKIRTPSLLLKIAPRWLPWGKLDYMGAMPLHANRKSLLDQHQPDLPRRKVSLGWKYEPILCSEVAHSAHLFAPPQRCSNWANLASSASSSRKFCGLAGRQCAQQPAS